MIRYIFLLFLVACSNNLYDSAPGYCTSYWDWNYYSKAYNMRPRYDVSITEETPKGAQLDLGGEDIDPLVIEALTDDIDSCMRQVSDNPVPDRTCVTIKIGDWRISCSGDQVLSWQADDQGCLDKGRTPSKECPCSWRSGVQDFHTIVTTPDFYLFADWYIRVFWGYTNPWALPDIANCASQGRI